MEFVEQSHQHITQFVYPSKIQTQMPKNLEMLGLKEKEIQRRLKDKNIGTLREETYRPVV